MATYEVTIPQTGEGLQEARLVRFLKEPGEAIARDEPILEMETDKAMVQIESPVNGTLLEWIVEPGTVLPIGAVVGRIAVEDGRASLSVSAGHERATSPPEPLMVAGSGAALRNALVPPRTRAYARECGLSDADVATLAERLGRKVLPADVDAFLATRSTLTPATVAPGTEELEALPASQRTLVYRMQQRAAEVIAASEEIAVPWASIDRARDELKRAARRNGWPVPTPFIIFAWCVVRAASELPVMRCTYAGDGMVRRHPHLNLGLAVTRNDDELLTAAVEEADRLTFVEFLERAADAIKRARAGEDQASSLLQLSLSNLSGTGVVRAVPVVVPPAIATLFLGSVHLEPYAEREGTVAFQRVALATLTFDHRVLNGVGAARFLSLLRRQVESLDAAALVAGE